MSRCAYCGAAGPDKHRAIVCEWCLRKSIVFTGIREVDLSVDKHGHVFIKISGGDMIGGRKFYLTQLTEGDFK